MSDWMDPVVERVAISICNAAWAWCGEDWSLASEEEQDEFRQGARAALDASGLRECVEALEMALPFLGSAATRSQIICGVDAGELYFVIDELLSKARGHQMKDTQHD